MRGQTPEGSRIAPKGKEKEENRKDTQNTRTKRSPVRHVRAIALNWIRSIVHLVGTLWDPEICETESALIGHMGQLVHVLPKALALLFEVSIITR